MYILSNVFLMGSDSSGIPCKAEKGDDGRYHLPGHVEGAPTAALRKAVAAAEPILAETGEAAILLAAPLPRYAEGGCCSDKSHVRNREEEEYEATMASVVQSATKVLEAVGKAKVASVINLFSVIGGHSMKNATSSSGASV